MSETIAGLHHVTMIAGNPQRNVDFYCGVLGLRLVKLTVNFDDPGSYHLYYGDEIGRPGSILTFFSWPGAYPGRVGNGQPVAVSLSVPVGSLPFWQERLTAREVPIGEVTERFGEMTLPLIDPDDLNLELVATDDARPTRSGGGIGSENAVRGLHSVSLRESDIVAADALLTGTMGFTALGQNEERVRYQTGEGGPGALVDLIPGEPGPNGRDGVGTIHHVAWRVRDEIVQRAWRDELLNLKLVVSPVMDRTYFTSIYFREPGGVLYEFATEGPGFAADESPEELGTALMLPPQYEASRATIERHLPKLRLKAPRLTDEGTQS